MKEQYKGIVGYEGRYEVSNLGNVKSLNYNKTGKEKNLIIINTPYQTVSLISNEGRKENFAIHRLVATAFIPNPESKPQVNHINGIKTDNSIGNLEWCTAKENIQHAYDSGIKICTENNYFKKVNPNQGKFGKRHPKAVSVIQYSLDGLKIKVWDSITDVKRKLGINTGHISSCCRLKCKTSGGYKWKYLLDEAITNIKNS